MEFLVDPIQRVPIYAGEALPAMSSAPSREEADSSCSRVGVDSLYRGDSQPVHKFLDPPPSYEFGGDNEDLGVLRVSSQDRAAVQLATVEGQEQSEGAVSMHTTVKVHPQAPGWTKRIRIGKQPPDRASCPERVGALEKTIRGYADKLGDHVVEPSLGLTFDSLGKAYDFYNLYSWEHGFGIRYGKSRLNAEKTKCMHARRSRPSPPD